VSSSAPACLMRSGQAVLARMCLQMPLQSGLAASRRLPHARRVVPRQSQNTLAPSSIRVATRLHAASLACQLAGRNTQKKNRGVPLKKQNSPGWSSGQRSAKCCAQGCAIHFSPLPCSDLGLGVAMIITAFTPFRFFAQTPLFSEADHAPLAATCAS